MSNLRAKAGDTLVIKQIYLNGTKRRSGACLFAPDMRDYPTVVVEAVRDRVDPRYYGTNGWHYTNDMIDFVIPGGGTKKLELKVGARLPIKKHLLDGAYHPEVTFGFVGGMSKFPTVTVKAILPDGAIFVDENVFTYSREMFALDGEQDNAQELTMAQLEDILGFKIKIVK